MLKENMKRERIQVRNSPFLGKNTQMKILKGNVCYP